MAKIGEVKNIKLEHEIEWKILYFSSLSGENSVVYSSSTFSFSDETWNLQIYPNGLQKSASGYISLFLRKISSGPPFKIKYSLGLKTVSGEKYSEASSEYMYTKENEGHGFYKLLLRSDLFEKKADLLPADVMTVFCSLRSPSTVETNEKTATNGKCSLCGKNVNVDNLSTHQKKDKAIKCSGCSAVLTLQDWCDHECLLEETDCKNVLSKSSKLHSDLKELFLKQNECDVVIRVKDQEFSAHKAILIARSSVFESTFLNDMIEKKSGIIDIEDCDPSSFSHFLQFLYCADSENISEENVFNLFVTADKYDVKDLKAECIEFIKSNLSVDLFCDAITLALQYSETDLIKLATDFFAKNLQSIIVTVKWQSFLAENPTQSNELFIKALVNQKKSVM